MERNKVGLAAEFAVASELFRRDIYAQLTLGHQKRTDLLIFSENNQLLRLEVKGKQAKDWPNCTGIFGKNVLLVLVDFAEKGEFDRPDFYVLTEKDWLDYVKMQVERLKLKGKRITIDKRNVPVFEDEVNKYGMKYRGMGIDTSKIQNHKERWDKIAEALKGVDN